MNIHTSLFLNKTLCKTLKGSYNTALKRMKVLSKIYIAAYFKIINNKFSLNFSGIWVSI